MRFKNKYQKKDNYPESVTVVDQKIAHTYKFIFKYEVFFENSYSRPTPFYISLVTISTGIFFGLLHIEGPLKYLFSMLVFLYIFLVFRYIENCIFQFMEIIKSQYVITTILRVYIHMLVSIFGYVYIAYKDFNIDDYIIVVLAIIEISYLYYRKKDITKGYSKFPFPQFSNQKIYDFMYGNEFFPELKIRKKRLLEPLLMLLYLFITIIFCLVMIVTT